MADNIVSGAWAGFTGSPAAVCEPSTANEEVFASRCSSGNSDEQRVETKRSDGSATRLPDWYRFSAHRSPSAMA